MKDDKPYVPVLLGTSRKGNYSESIAKFVSSEAEKFGFESNVISPKDHLEFPVTARAGQETKKKTSWHLTMNRACGLVIVTPEYNHGYPGELKLMLDSLYEEYRNKPVAVFGVSSGKLGGARVVENLLPVLIELNMHYIKSKIYFSDAEKLASKKSNLTGSKYRSKVSEIFEKMKDSFKFDK